MFSAFLSLDQTSLLEFLHILTTNHKLVFAPVNNEPEFIMGLCHWLLVMGTHKSLGANDVKKSGENKDSEGDYPYILFKAIVTVKAHVRHTSMHFFVFNCLYAS